MLRAGTAMLGLHLVTALDSIRPPTGKARYVEAGTPADGVDLRDEILAFVERNEWPGHQGQPFAGGDFAVSSVAELARVLNNIRPDGRSWYRVRLCEGDPDAWTLPVQGAIALDRDFGAGGLLVEPHIGHDPQLDIRFNVITNRGAARSVHVRGCCFVTRGADRADGSGLAAYPVGTFATSQPAFTAERRLIPLLRIESNRFGRLFVRGETVASWRQWSVPVYLERAEQLILRDNVTDGVSGFARHYSTRLLVVDGNDLRAVSGDVLQGNVWYDLHGYENSVFDDVKSYYLIRNNLVARQPNVTGSSNTHADIAHVDFYQNIMTFGQRNAGRVLSRLIEDNVGVFLDRSEKLSDFNGVDEKGGGPRKWRTTSGSFVQDNTDDLIKSVIGFNVMAVAINGINVGTRNGGVNYIIQNVIVAPPDRPQNTDDQEFLACRIQHYSHPGGRTILRNNIVGAETALPAGGRGLDEVGTTIVAFNRSGAYASRFVGPFEFVHRPRPISRWRIDENASKNVLMHAVRTIFTAKNGRSNYGWRP